MFDLTVKYVIDDRFYRMETGVGKFFWPVTTEAGHCYVMDEIVPKVGYSAAVDMGTPPKDLPAGYDYSGDVRYDAATNLWGGKWRTPTYPEWEELFANCTWTTSSLDSIMTFTSKITGKSLTVKFDGYKDGNTATSIHQGYYWSSTSNPDNILRDKSTMFRLNTSPPVNNTANRYTGLPIRPVYTK